MSEPVYTVHADSVAAISRRWANAGPVIEREMRVGMTRATMLIERKAKADVKHDTGDLRRRITRKVTVSGRDIVGIVGAYAPHAEPVEKGRRAGAPMPPKGALLDWMRRHGIDAELEYVIRRAIKARGIPPAPYLIPALREQLPQINRELGPLVAQRVLAELSRGVRR